MELRLITSTGVTRHPVEELSELLARDDGVVWLDVPTCDQEAARVLREGFGFHPLAVRDCLGRNRVPKVHAYPDHTFLVLHAPEHGDLGHVHYVELDQFVSARYLVTTHGPLNRALELSVATRETDAVLARIEAGRFAPDSGFALSYAIVSALSRRQEAFIGSVTAHVWALEQRVTSGHLGDPEQFLEELFQARHGLMAVRTMGTHSREIYGRLAVLPRLPATAEPFVRDLVDQFDRVWRIADGEKEYLQGVIEFYRARTETKMTIAAERLAVIAAVTLPITALSSVYGMNIIVNEHTHYGQLAVVLAVMVAMSALLLRWTKRQGWW